MNNEGFPRRLEVIPWPERKNGYAEKLRNLVGDIVAQVNARAEKECGIKGLLNPDGTISMEGFAAENGGIYSQAEVDRDLADVYGNEVSNSVSHGLKYGSPEQQARVKDWQESREKSKSNQVEMVIMVLLHKILSEEFLVVRSAKLDDYASGVDMLIVNRKTGAVICAIDDVHKEGEDDSKKAEKTRRIADKGGTTVRYGLASRNNELKRTKLEHVPVFYLGLNSEQFNELLNAMGSGIGSAASAKEIEIFSQFVQALETQKDGIASLILKSKDLRNNITQLGSSIKRLKQIARDAQQPHLNQLPAAA
jgi:uncharacterized Zn finger protein (UPF0148 family)